LENALINKKDCEHEWDGPKIELKPPNDPGWTVTCSKCGADFFTWFEKQNKEGDIK
jgi:hypothetical protein